MVVILGKGKGKGARDSLRLRALPGDCFFTRVPHWIGADQSHYDAFVIACGWADVLFALPSLRENGVLRQPRFWIGIVAFCCRCCLRVFAAALASGQWRGDGFRPIHLMGHRESFSGALQWWHGCVTAHAKYYRPIVHDRMGIDWLDHRCCGTGRPRYAATSRCRHPYRCMADLHLLRAQLLCSRSGRFPHPRPLDCGSRHRQRPCCSSVTSRHRSYPTALLRRWWRFALLALPQTWAENDRSAENQLLIWGEGILNGDLNTGSAILADSEKIAPLYYLQQAEGVRPDLDITVLPDEAAYRAEMDARLAAGQTVYLARYLPRLPYAMRSNGPLAEMIVERETALLQNEPLVSAAGIDLIDVTVSAESPYDPTQTAVTFTWQATEPATEPLLVHLRWSGDAVAGTATKGRHPVNNLYPTVAWQPGEIVTDFHQLPRPLAPHPQTLVLQVALAPAFTPAADLNWQTAATVALPAATAAATVTPLRVDLGDPISDGTSVPAQIRPNTPSPSHSADITLMPTR